MQKKYLISCLILFLISNRVVAQNYSLPSTFEECLQTAKRWCYCNFNTCNPGRKFTKIFCITDYYQMNDNIGDYTFIQGKIHYENYIGLPQSFIFMMKVYPSYIVFSKQSVSPTKGKLVWESCTTKRGSCR